MKLRPTDPLVVLWLLLPAAAWGVHGFLDDLSRDAAFYVYAGQRVMDGQAPYVGLMNRAGPLAHLLPGLGVGLGRAAGWGDVVGVRVLFFALVVVTPVLAYLAARDGFRSRLGGSVAATTMLCCQGFALAATSGPQSKQPMVLFLLLALLLLLRRRMLPAGVATALATLAWQPVFLVAAGAALVMAATTRGGLRPRLRALAGYLAGGALTLAVTVAGFALAGAVGPFLDGFWRANAGHTRQPGALARPARAWEQASDWFGWSVWLVLAGVGLGLALGVAALLRWKGEDGAREVRSRSLALGVATVAAAGWSLYAFNGAADALLVQPVAALGLGATVAVLAHAADRWHRARGAIVAVVGAFVVVATVLTVQATLAARSSDLRATRAEVHELFAPLPDDATVLTDRAPQPLALTGRRNVSRYLLYGGGMTSWIDAEWPGGLAGYVTWLRDQEPTVLITSSRKVDPFLRPLLSDYVVVGDELRWRVQLHESVDPAVREAVAAAIRSPAGG